MSGLFDGLGMRAALYRNMQRKKSTKQQEGIGFGIGNATVTYS
jgi:hypothetical protein